MNRSYLKQSDSLFFQIASLSQEYDLMKVISSGYLESIQIEKQNKKTLLLSSITISSTYEPESCLALTYCPI